MAATRRRARTFTLTAEGTDRYPSLHAALSSPRARTALHNLFRSWLQHRTDQVRAVVADHSARNGGQPPTPAQIAAAVDPPFPSEAAAAWYLHQVTASPQPTAPPGETQILEDPLLGVADPLLGTARGHSAPSHTLSPGPAPEACPERSRRGASHLQPGIRNPRPPGTRP